MLKKGMISYLMILIMVVSCFQSITVFGDTSYTTEFVHQTIEDVMSALIGNEELSDWQIIALSRGGYTVNDKQYDRIKDEVKECKGEYRKVTDYERIALTADALGKDAQNICGYNFIEKIYNNEKMTLQGINGPIFALIALDSNAYDVPSNAKWNRQSLIDCILSYQKSDGGMSLSLGDDSSVDITAMALQALSKYQYKPEVKSATEAALKYLSAKQLPNGGFEDFDENSCESVAQVIIALSSLGIDGHNEPSFVKSGRSLIDRLYDFKTDDKMFKHTENGKSDEIGTEQALMALVSYSRFLSGDKTLFSYSEGKADVISDWADKSVKEMLDSGVMTYVNGKFKPQDNITRGDFAAAIVKILKLNVDSESNFKFDDVNAIDSNYIYIKAASDNNIINGKSDNQFKPNDFISREEMAAILYRGLKLDKLDKSSEQSIKDISEVSEWAVDGVMAVYSNKIIQGNNGIFSPKGFVTREMAAVIAMRVNEIVSSK